MKCYKCGSFLYENDYCVEFGADVSTYKRIVKKSNELYNRGLEMAQGEYVYFLDSDDMITSNALEELYMLAKQDDLGGIFFDSQVLVDSEQVEHFADSYICMRKGVYPAAVTSGAELLDLFVKNNEWMVYVQRQFWRREYLLNNIDSFYNSSQFFNFVRNI